VGLIDNQQALEAFRLEWGASRLLKLVAEHQRLFINWAVGVGKSHCMDDLVELAVAGGRYDVVLVLVPTRKILDERRWVKNPPPDVPVFNLRPRPSKLCGQADAEWLVLERKGMSLLAKVTLCKQCENKPRCEWHTQYQSAELKRAAVIYGTQTHLERDPFFVARVQGWTKAESPLLLLDEASFVAKSRKRTISQQELKMYLEVLDKIDDEQ
jgi:hypothetical protein